MTTSGAAQARMGANVNTAISLSGLALAKWYHDGEGFVELATRRKWSGTNYPGLMSGVTGTLSDVVSSFIANRGISYDMSGYTTLAEATAMMNFNDDTMKQGIELLKDFKNNPIQDP